MTFAFADKSRHCEEWTPPQRGDNEAISVLL